MGIFSFMDSFVMVFRLFVFPGGAGGCYCAPAGISSSAVGLPRALGACTQSAVFPLYLTLVCVLRERRGARAGSCLAPSFGPFLYFHFSLVPGIAPSLGRRGDTVSTFS